MAPKQKSLKTYSDVSFFYSDNEASSLYRSETVTSPRRINLFLIRDSYWPYQREKRGDIIVQIISNLCNL